MHLRDALAGTLRAIRTQRQFRYVDLADASFKTAISKLERGQAGVTFEQLDRIAVALGFDTLALITLCLASRDALDVGTVVARAESELSTFEAIGGLGLLADHLRCGRRLRRGR